MGIRIALVEEKILYRNAFKQLFASLPNVEVVNEVSCVADLVTDMAKNKRLPDICVFHFTSFTSSEVAAIREMRRSFKKVKLLVIAQHTDKSLVDKLKLEKVRAVLSATSPLAELQKAVTSIRAATGHYPQVFDPPKIFLHESPVVGIKRRNISAKHLQLLELCLTDLTYAEIAKKMGRSVKSIEGFRDVLFHKFKVTNRTAMVLFALKNGLIDFPGDQEALPRGATGQE